MAQKYKKSYAERRAAYRRKQRQNTGGSSAPASQQAASARQQRVAAEDANPLYSPSVQLSGNALAKAARQLAGIEITPQLRALQQQAKTTRQQGSRLADRAGGYYDTLAGRSQQAQSMAQAITDRLNTTLTGIGAETQGAIREAGAEEQSRLQADAVQRGIGLEGGAVVDAATEQAAAEARAATTGQALRTAGAQQGAGAEQLVNALAASGQLAGGEVQGQIAARQQGLLGQIGAQRAGVQAQRGPLTTKYATELRQSGFENLAILAANDIKYKSVEQGALNAERQFALAVARAREAARANRVGELNAAADNVLAAQKFASAQAREAYQRINKIGPYKPAENDRPNEPQSSISLKRGIGNAMDDYTRMLKAGKSLDSIEKYLRNRKKVAPDVLAAARDLAQYGYITRPTLKMLRNAGVLNIPKGWREEPYGGT